MAKKTKVTADLFATPTFTGFEIEGEEKKEVIEESVITDFNITLISTTNEPTVVETEETLENLIKNDAPSFSENIIIDTEIQTNKQTNPIIPESEQVTSELLKDSIELFSPKSKVLISKALLITTINSDVENLYAREVAKELADLKKEVNAEKKIRKKPLNDELDSIDEKSNNIIQPMDSQVERLKPLITKWETEIEKRRLEEKSKLEKEKADREAKEKAEIERVSKIRNEIKLLRDGSLKSINESSTVLMLNNIQTKLSNWKPKQEFFMEFFDEVETTLKNDMQALIDSRMVIVKDLEEQRAKTAELEKTNKEAADKEKALLEEKLASDKQKADLEARVSKANEDSLELSARQELTILVASLGIKDIESYLNKIQTQYGNCRESVKNRDTILQSFMKEQLEEKQLSNLNAIKMKNQRVDFIFTIQDESKVPIEYYSIDESKIKKAILENRPLLEKDINSFKIEGVNIESKTQTVLKK